MRTHAFTISLAVAVFAAGPVHGQTPAGQPVTRADVSLSTGLFSAATEQVEAPGLGRSPYDEWVHMALVDVTAGYYWTDHLKTEIAAAWTSEGESYGSGRIELTGSQTGWVFHTTHQTARQIGIGQLWQFGRNAMFHPWIGAGVEVVHRAHELDRPAQFVYPTESTGRPPVQIPVPQWRLTSTTTRVLPFASAGFKAYFNERGFVRSDLKLHVRNGVEQVIWKIGVGVDF